MAPRIRSPGSPPHRTTTMAATWHSGGGGGGGWCDPLDEFDPLGSARAGGNLELDPLQVSPGAGMARPARRAAGEENDPLATRSPPRMAASKRGKGGSGVVTGNWDDLLM
mmetsp:Transcript_83748/g.236544  ORF Transcript_83748/g.236544 Transcript_83748/m.236544 type:complete len:110 (+) Transcript_83748:2034-2363(+)